MGYSRWIVAGLCAIAMAIAATLHAASSQARVPRQNQPAQAGAFHLEEATIADVHRGIRSGDLTCRGLVQEYVDRARAYNGTCNALVTEDKAADVLPNYDDYKTAV